jgi:uncharacterized repeat protein (TIGR03803 family)
MSHRFLHLLPALLIAFALAPLVATPALAATTKTVHSFNGEQHGSSPNSGFVADSAGNLYGVTGGGGAYGQGTVFKLSPTSGGGWSSTVIYNFKGSSDGYRPSGGLIFDAAGSLYGTTVSGGEGGGCFLAACGTVFELKHNPDGSWTKSILHTFHNGSGGSGPVGQLVFDQAGNLYGATSGGGAQIGGVVFELSPSSGGQWTGTVLHSFIYPSSKDGSSPTGGLVLDEAGNLFGTATYGGNGCNASGGCGIAFELSKGSDGKWTETILHNFAAGGDGAFPVGALIPDQVGNLYGTADNGGTGAGIGCNYGCGVVFELTRGSNGLWTETVLYNFQGTNDGSEPESALTFDIGGNLYGTTYDGGGLGTCRDGGCGTAFELSPSAGGHWSESVLWRFSGGSDGASPSSGLILSASGQLAGETFTGGPSKGNGGAFTLAPGAGGQWSLSLLSSFPNTDGDFPPGDLVADAAGNLYGTTSSGGTNAIGAVYQLAPVAGGGWKESVIHSFQSGQLQYFRLPSGTFPSRLVLDSAGNLYGETQTGGDHSIGTVYELSPNGSGQWNEKTLYTFVGGKDGDYPTGGLVFDAAGNLYGTTAYGGLGSQLGKPKSGPGLVFELSPGTNGKWTQSVIYRFSGYPSDGTNSQGGLIFDSTGNLYGTTLQGGGGNCVDDLLAPIGCGTVFELSPAGNGLWTETVLHSFVSFASDAAFPFDSLVFDRAGNLFGTTMQGLSNNGCKSCGAVFELSPQAGGGWNESVLFAFPDPANGIYPVGRLAVDSAGNLYGTTSQKFGGCAGSVCGTAFELSPASGNWTISVLHSFTTSGDDGGSPGSGLVFLPSGKLYGTTDNGGSAGEGTVFEITP